MTDLGTDQRLLIAAHELGHALTWHALGFTVDEIRVVGRGDSAHGWVWLKHTKDSLSTLEKERAYHAGLLAGREAELRWCDENRMKFVEYTCAGDMDNLRRRRRTTFGRQVSHSAATSDARRLIRSKWGRIVRLAPLLAARGSLSPSRI
jgi:hypothetical protein